VVRTQHDERRLRGRPVDAHNVLADHARDVAAVGGAPLVEHRGDEVPVRHPRHDHPVVASGDAHRQVQEPAEREHRGDRPQERRVEDAAENAEHRHRDQCEDKGADREPAGLA
jgi:hypothetical protein